MADIEVEINGQKLNAKPNQTVIEVADEAGIYIPRFCYHKHLSVAANCRMCLVEVEKAPKALPACATPVMPGMKVFTKSPATVAAQRAVMEFLLINHPLDCPICDQGGECELQDVSMGYGSSHSEYDECKRSVADEDIGPLIATEMTRCITCTRCVRFGEEVAGVRELGVVNRGEHSEVSTFVKHAVTSEVSGNIIDLCPVGALTSKPYRFTARAWELEQSPSISPHDSLGANINVHTRYGEVKRVVSRENDAVNQTWISDRDRFAYAGLSNPNRVLEPMIKLKNGWEAVSWQKALEHAAAGISEVIAQHGADRLGGLASPTATVEEMYLLQKFIRELGSPHVDHRLREMDTRDELVAHLHPGSDISLDDYEQSDAILLVGSNIQKEMPLISLRTRSAQLRGADVFALNSVDYDFNFAVKDEDIVAPHLLTNVLKEMVTGTHRLATALQQKQKVSIVLGAQAMHHPQAAEIRELIKQLAEQCHAKVVTVTDGGNSAGGWLAGAVPHRHAGGELVANKGLNAYDMITKPRDAYVLLNIDPEYDMANAAKTLAAMKHAAFVVALSTHHCPLLEEHADVVLPIAAYTETSGTYVNLLGHWQSFSGVAKAAGESRPAWKVLRVLGNFLDLEGFNYESSQQVKEELRTCVDNARVEVAQVEPAPAVQPMKGMSRIGEIPIYAVDTLTRHSLPLQHAQVAMEGELAVVKLHPDTATKLKLADGMHAKVQQGGADVVLPVVVDVNIAPDAAWIAGGIAETRMLGDLFGEVHVEAATN